MPVGIAREVESVGTRELRLVPVGGGEHRVDEASAGDRDARDGCLFPRVAFRRRLERSVEAKQLFDGGPAETRIRAQPLHFAGMVEEGEGAVADQVHGRLVPGDQEQEDHCDELVFVEPLPRLFRRHESAHEVVAPHRAPQPDEPPDVTQERQGARDRAELPQPEGVATTIFWDHL